ncbi:MAG TPA: oligopeptide:H+ symporter [Candidatus Limnocylindria bacterium]|nr:oligopeptide:H+ symporter [Candidatus Limnocylindria bacterium]
MDTARTFFGHPRGLATLFFTEFWERFSYYGMRAVLILFMTAPVAAGGLGFDAARAGVIYGTYTALVYLAALPGGWLADRFLGQRRAVLYGGGVIMLGHVCLAVPSLASFYVGLGCIVAGTGLLKPNVSAMVGALYAPDDARRDAGFSLFYMGINLGAFLAPLVCGWLAQGEGFGALLESFGWRREAAWHWGFGAAAVGMFFGLVQYLGGWRLLGDAGLRPVVPDAAAERVRSRRQLVAALAGIGLGGAVLAALVRSGVVPATPEGLGNAFGVVLLIVTVAFFAGLLGARGWTREERARLMTILVLFLAAAIFWSVFEQAGSTLNLFAERSTETRLFGRAFPASWFQSANPVFIILLAPAFAWLWAHLGRRDPSSPAKFAAGLVFAAAGFGVMAVAAHLAADGKVSPFWLLAAYLLHTIGELCLSPVGLSAMSRLAPARVAGLMMGAWFLAAAVGNYLGGRVAGLYEALSLPSLFGAVTLIALAAGVGLALLVRPIERRLATAQPDAA